MSDDDVIRSRRWFTADMVPPGTGLRYFVKAGPSVALTRGFKTKAEASAWIDGFGDQLDWRSGFLFRLKGDDRNFSIINRRGEPTVL